MTSPLLNWATSNTRTIPVAGIVLSCWSSVLTISLIQRNHSSTIISHLWHGSSPITAAMLLLYTGTDLNECAEPHWSTWLGSFITAQVKNCAALLIIDLYDHDHVRVSRIWMLLSCSSKAWQLLAERPKLTVVHWSVATSYFSHNWKAKNIIRIIPYDTESKEQQ